MELIDWAVLSLTLTFIVVYGLWKNNAHKNIKDYIRGGNQASWFTVGLSVMATQASAITFLSTPGQAFNDGMGFVQFYFGLPFAMVIICLFFLPVYHKLKVYTAYEFLEKRFDLKNPNPNRHFVPHSKGLGSRDHHLRPGHYFECSIGLES